MPPVITFTTDIFHPLLTPLTTYTYTTGSSESDPVSATDEERLPPGGFSLRHGFPLWFQRARRSAGNSATSSRNVSGSHGSIDQQVQAASSARMQSPMTPDLPGSSRGSPARLRQAGVSFEGPPKDVTVIEVLRYVRSAFAEEDVLDALPLEAAGNPGAWHAWRAHRRATRQQSPSSSSEEASQVQPDDIETELAAPGAHQRLAGSRSTARARQPGEWNWEGVWEERVRRGVDASQSDAVLYGSAGGKDDIVCHSEQKVCYIELI